MARALARSELRNEIAHEYRLEDLKELFSAVLEHSEKLMAIIAKTRQYCARYID